MKLATKPDQHIKDKESGDGSDHYVLLLYLIEADNCVENFANTMENNKDLLSKQDCPCDTEHMFTCPAGQKTVTSKGTVGQATLSRVMNQLAQLNSEADLTLVSW